MLDFIIANQAVLWQLALLAGLSAVAGMLLVPWVVVRMPADYFERKERRLPTSKYPVASAVAKVARNVLGCVLMIAGLMMLVLPGPGFLALLVGAGMVSFPGKHRFIRSIIGRPALLNPINLMRQRAGVAPLQVSR
jgi:hypothetical protein